MRRFAIVIAVLLLTVVSFGQQPAAPANVAGTWTGSFKPSIDGQPKREEKATLVLKQEGTVVTGTAGPPELQSAIARGKAEATKEGTVVTFMLVNDGISMQFNLKLVDGHLKGTAKAERDGQKLSAELDLTRAK